MRLFCKKIVNVLQDSESHKDEDNMESLDVSKSPEKPIRNLKLYNVKL